MALSARDLAVGLVLIVVGLIADFGASYLLPAPAACTTNQCNAAEIIGLVALLLLILGVLLQARALWNARTPSVLPPGFQPGSTTPGAWSGVPMNAAPPPPPPWPAAAPVPAGPAGAGGTGEPAPTVLCRRCGSAYPVGQFAYCSKCGSPLPFAP